MKGQLFEVKHVPKKRRDSHCLMVEYEADGTPTEKREEGEFQVTILFKDTSNMYGYALTYCRHHLAVFAMEVEKYATQALRRRSK